MRPLSISVALAVLLAAGLPGQDLPQWVLLLARVKQHGRASFEHIPDYACLETINRFEKPRNGASFKPIDTLLLEVASVGGKELFARRGAARFGDGDLRAFISEGVISSGAFSATPLNLFIQDVARITPLAQEGIFTGMTLGFHFEESAMSAGFVVQSGGSKDRAGVRGTFWVDPQTLDLVRIEEQAVDLPPSLLMRDVTTSIHYARTPIGSSDPLLPQSAETVVTDFYGAERKNSIEFTGCREYSSESTIHFGVPVPEPPPPAPKKK
ncbi:MAG: hypothetical protein ABSH44_21085 [Bryobacteraceae bacterium]